MDLALFLPAFVAGLFTFLAPCTLPLVPVYLSFIGGISGPGMAGVAGGAKANRKVFTNGLFFILGFALPLIAFGILAGLLGQYYSPLRLWLGRAGGLAVVIFGLLMLGAIRLPALSRDKRFSVAGYVTPGKPASSLLLGGAFALGWTPCVGPILATLLFLATQSSSALQGGLLLTIFSAGLAVPFLAMALTIGRASSFINKLARAFEKWRVVILAFFGLIAGFLLNLALVSVGAKLLPPLGDLALTLLNSAPLILPVLSAATIGYAAHRMADVDVMGWIGGMLLIPLGLLLLTDNFGIVIEYAYVIFEAFNYQGILKFL